MSFKSGVQHEPMPVTEKDTAMDKVAGMKESEEWGGGI